MVLGCFRIHLNYVFCCFQILCLVVQYKNYITHPLSYIVNRKTVQFYIGLCFELLIFFLVIWLALTRLLIFYDNLKVSACKIFLQISLSQKFHSHLHFGQYQLTIAFHSEIFFYTQYAKVMGITIVFQDFYLYNNNILY